VLLTAETQAKSTSLHSSESQDSHYSGDVLEELKENISPLRPKPTRTVESQNPVISDVVDCDTAGSHLLIVDMGTPLRRTTFVRDADRCSPKCVTRTPERRIVSVSGFQSAPSSPQAVPDCYGTPLRRTTFVKNSPKLKPCGHMESSSIFEKLRRNCEDNVMGSVEESHVLLVSVPDEHPETAVKTCRQHLRSDDPLRDVSRSPLILEDRLLHLQDVNQLDTLQRPRSSVASSQVSPSESEYHTAITTPYDESLSDDEGADEFLDSNVCSETITGDVSLCQQQLALKASNDITSINNDYTLMENVGAEDLSTKPTNSVCIDFQQANVVTSRIDEYEVRTEVVSEVLESELHMDEIMCSLHPAEAVKPSCSCASANLYEVVYKHEMADFECGGNERQFFHCSGKTVHADDVRCGTSAHSNGCMSLVSDGHFSAMKYQSTPLLNNKLSGIGTVSHTSVHDVDGEPSQAATNGFEVALHEEKMMRPVSSEKVHGLFHIPADGDASYSFNSQTYTKICATPAFTADVPEGTDGYNRTYTKSADNKRVGSLSGSRPASRPLFTDTATVTNTTEDGSTGVVPLDMAQSGLHGAAVILPETYKPNPPTKLELEEWNKSVRLSGIRSDGRKSVMDTGVFSQVGGQTWHMISPGQKRQSLIARLHGNGQQPSAESDAAVISVERDTREQLEGDGSPVRKRPLIAASKPREYCFLM